MKAFGGIPNVVIASPEIYSFRLTDQFDFLMMGCDGIFDNLTNKEIFESIMATFDPETPVTVYSQNSKPVFKSKYKADDVYGQMGLIVDSIFKSCFKSYSTDNLSVILICFEGFEAIFNTQSLIKSAINLKETRNEIVTLYPLITRFDQNHIKRAESKRKASSKLDSRSMSK